MTLSSCNGNDDRSSEAQAWDKIIVPGPGKVESDESTPELVSSQYVWSGGTPNYNGNDDDANGKNGKDSPVSLAEKNSDYYLLLAAAFGNPAGRWSPPI